MSKSKLCSVVFSVLVLFGVSGIFASFNDFKDEFLRQPEKLEKWVSMEKAVDRWVDGKGRHIDQGIKETVIVLNLLGYKTAMSCEGHLSESLSYPWIDFDVECEEYRQCEKEIISVQKKNNTFLKKDKLTEEERAIEENLSGQRNKIGNKLNQVIQEKLTPVYSQLEKFYDGKSVSYDRVIRFEGHFPRRIYSTGGARQCIRSSEQKAEKLEEYKDEMREFTDYLIWDFLNK